MTAAIPPYGAATPVRIEFHKGSLKALLGGLPLTGILAAVSIMGAIWPEKYLTNGFPHLGTFLVTEAPPRAGLPQTRYRIMLPPFDGAAGPVEQGVRGFAPRLWLGHYQREWHRTPGR